MNNKDTKPTYFFIVPIQFYTLSINEPTELQYLISVLKSLVWRNYYSTDILEHFGLMPYHHNTVAFYIRAHSNDQPTLYKEVTTYLVKVLDYIINDPFDKKPPRYSYKLHYPFIELDYKPENMFLTQIYNTRRPLVNHHMFNPHFKLPEFISEYNDVYECSFEFQSKNSTATDKGIQPIDFFKSFFHNYTQTLQQIQISPIKKILTKSINNSKHHPTITFIVSSPNSTYTPDDIYYLTKNLINNCGLNYTFEPVFSIDNFLSSFDIHQV